MNQRKHKREHYRRYHLHLQYWARPDGEEGRWHHYRVRSVYGLRIGSPTYRGTLTDVRVAPLVAPPLVVAYKESLSPDDEAFIARAEDAGATRILISPDDGLLSDGISGIRFADAALYRVKPTEPTVPFPE